MNFEDIYLAYNLDILLDLYEQLKYKALYNGVLDKNTNSNEFIDVIVKNIQYVEVNNDDDDSGDEHEYYNYET